LNEKLKAIIETYCENLPTEIDRIAEACDASDLEQIRQGAHRLKGTARTLGIDALEAALAILEYHATPTRDEALAQFSFSEQVVYLRELASCVRPSDSRLWSLAIGA
jgi:HPt (histidine-containing phosphotransfer) domain-containing protein